VARERRVQCAFDLGNCLRRPCEFGRPFLLARPDARQVVPLRAQRLGQGPRVAQRRLQQLDVIRRRFHTPMLPRGHHDREAIAEEMGRNTLGIMCEVHNCSARSAISTNSDSIGCLGRSPQ